MNLDLELNKIASKIKTCADKLNQLRDLKEFDELKFNPGDKYKYTYVVAGCIVDINLAGFHCQCALKDLSKKDVQQLIISIFSATKYLEIDLPNEKYPAIKEMLNEIKDLVTEIFSDLQEIQGDIAACF